MSRRERRWERIRMRGKVRGGVPEVEGAAMMLGQFQHGWIQQVDYLSAQIQFYLQRRTFYFVFEGQGFRC